MIYLYFLPFADEIYGSKIEKICKKTDDENSVPSVAGTLLARFAAYEKTGVTMEKAEISYEKSGKPFFKNMPNVHFNISHTDGAVAVAIGDSELGVDAEKIKEAKMTVAEKLFSKHEREFIEQSEDKNKAFFYVWTRKEAFAKMTGDGLKRENLGLCTFEMDITTEEKDGYVISVCSKNKEEIKEKENFIERFIKTCEKMIY